MHYRDKLSHIQKQYNLLTQLEQYFRSQLNLTPCVGVELEFYIHKHMDIASLQEKTGHEIKAEKGQNQYEINIQPSQDLVTYAKYIDEIRKKIIHFSDKLGGRADFSSKPFADDYGSSMHIHLNFPEDDDIEKYAKILCHYLPDTLDYFLPSLEDYVRLDSKFMAPTHISYGGNNRSVLIRIPDSEPKRLEHRLAGANAEPVLIIYTILQSIKKGLQNLDAIPPLEKTFGNAFDPQYGLRKIIP